MNYNSYKEKGIDVSLGKEDCEKLVAKKYFVCIGSDYNFGESKKKMYFEILSKNIKIPFVSLSKKDATAKDFLNCEECIDLINNSLFVIVQVMGINGVHSNLEKNELPLKEVSSNWESDYIKLSWKIKVPKILLYFSKRRLNEEDGSNFQEFPQFVSRPMVRSARGYYDEFVKIIYKNSAQRANKLAADFLIQAHVNALHKNLDIEDKKEIDEIKKDKALSGDKYIIFAHARSGSTTLLRVLEQHEELKMAHEPFSQGYFIDGLSRKKIREISSKKDLYVSLLDIFRKNNGFKHIQQHIDINLNKELLLLEKVKIIFLYRKNLLETAISSKISSMVKDWGWNPDKFKEKTKNFKFPSINIKEIEQIINKIKTQNNEYKSFIMENNIPFFELAYEDLFGPSITYEKKVEIINKIFDFLNKSHISDPKKIEKIKHMLNPEEMKTGSVDLYKKIPNIMEIEKTFGSKENGYLFKNNQEKIEPSFDGAKNIFNGFRRKN